MSSKPQVFATPHEPGDKVGAREEIERKTLEFLRNGGNVQRIERGQTAFKVSKHIVINAERQDKAGTIERRD